MLDASVAEFVGYTCSGMAGCVSRDSQPLAVMQMLVVSRLMPDAHAGCVPHARQAASIQHLARAGRILFNYQPLTVRGKPIYVAPKRLCVAFGRGESWESRVCGMANAHGAHVKRP